MDARARWRRRGPRRGARCAGQVRHGALPHTPPRHGAQCADGDSANGQHQHEQQGGDSERVQHGQAAADLDEAARPVV